MYVINIIYKLLVNAVSGSVNLQFNGNLDIMLDPSCFIERHTFPAFVCSRDYHA